MTREEAIADIRDNIKPIVGGISLDMAIKALEQEPCEDAISRESIKQKLQEHHDFFVNAYGGFSNLPQNDKSRVDEITNCIAMVVNEPSVTPQPKVGQWNRVVDKAGHCVWECDKCGWQQRFNTNYCPDCGAKKQEEEENDD